MATIADQFVDTYCIVEDNSRKRSFITLGKLIKFKYMIEKPEVYVFQENVVHDKLIDIDGGIPAVLTRYRFVKALRACGDNAPRLFILLNQLFRKEMIKVCFPEVWLLWHNHMAVKQSRRDKHEMIVARKALRKSKTAMEAHKLHRDIQTLTSNHSVRQCAIDMRRNRLV